MADNDPRRNIGLPPRTAPGTDWASQRGAQQWFNDPAGVEPMFASIENKSLLDQQARISQRGLANAQLAANQQAMDQAQKLFDLQMKQYREDQARQAEQDRLQREAEARRKELERVGRESAFDEIARWAEERGMDPGQVRSAFKTLGQYDYNNTAKLLATVRGTQTWADRFGAVTKARAANGWNYMSEDEILKQEDSYREALSQYGLPKSFYDTKEDFQNWIANDVSVAEVTDRAKLASSLANSVDQGTRDAFKQYWGVGQGDLTAYFLDHTRAVDLLQKQVNAAELASEANAAGIGGTDAGLFETLAGKDISRQEFRQAAERTGVTQEDWKRLAQVSGQSLTQASLLNANLGLDAGTTKKLKKLSSQERGRFTGSSGGASALGAGSTVGAY